MGMDSYPVYFELVNGCFPAQRWVCFTDYRGLLFMVCSHVYNRVQEGGPGGGGGGTVREDSKRFCLLVPPGSLSKELDKMFYSS